MKRRLIAAISLSLSLTGVYSDTVAQQSPAPIIHGDVTGSEVTTESPVESEARAQEASETLTATNGDAASLGTGNASSAPGTITRNGVTESSLLGPDGTYRVTENTPPSVSAPEGTSVEIVPAATAPVANAPAEESGDEPAAADTDGDWVPDREEVNVYGTAPDTWDTDGDGLSDGEELYVAGTDPFLWDTNGDGISDAGIASEAAADPLIVEDTGTVVAEDAAPAASGVDSDNDRLADRDEAAVGTDPTTPDADGDGYYDGDEVNLGTDPLDPASFPVEE
jgi:hypothetical protein